LFKIELNHIGNYACFSLIFVVDDVSCEAHYQVV